MPTETAMLLSEQEWEDLAYMVTIFEMQQKTLAHVPSIANDPLRQRCVVLAHRIKDATS
jgi:hypothetical protein